MMQSERHVVAVPGGRVVLVLHLPRAAAPAPCVVACHGLHASKDSDKYVLLGAELPAVGLALARFDFRGCGESTGREDETTVASRIEDVEAVLGALARHPRLDGRFGLLGSSLGGFVALFAAARRPGTPVVTWNAPASLSGLANDDRDDSRNLGVAFALECMTGRYALAPKGVSHHLVIQGEADDVVPMEHGVQLHAQAAAPCDLHVIPAADHRLTDPTHRHDAITHTRAWLLRCFSSEGASAAPSDTSPRR